MTADERSLYRSAESSYIHMQQRYAECKQLMLHRGSCVDLNKDSAIQQFEDLSAMETWLIDVELSVKRVKGKLGFDGWGLTGDRYVIGLEWQEVADRRHIAAQLAKDMAKAWVAAMFVDHLERGIPADYGRIAA